VRDWTKWPATPAADQARLASQALAAQLRAERQHDNDKERTPGLDVIELGVKNV
jgi:hypothetical protein